MSFWQYNAWTEAFQERKADELAVQIQGAFMCAYWSSATRHKKSLQSVLNSIRAPRKKRVKREPIDQSKVEAQFNAYEELKNNGWTTNL